MTILVVAAHPDDEVLGCGGTIARLSGTHETHILILGEGITSRYDDPSAADPTLLSRLREDAMAAGQILGAKSVSLEALPDNRFDQVPLLDIVKRVERTIAALKPAVIYTHHSGDLNLDHLLTFRAVMIAARPVGACPVDEIFSFEVPSSTEWAFQQFSPPFRPNTFVDVSGTIETKVRAMTQYESEARSFPHPRSAEALRTLARRYGSMVGLEYGEAHELVRSVRR